MPKTETATNILVNALTCIDQAKFSSSLQSGIFGNTLRYITPYISWPIRLVLSNLWLFSPIVDMILSKDHTTNALIRTTKAITVLRAGDAENVIPESAQAKINFRLAPGDKSYKVKQMIESIIADSRVSVSIASETLEVRNFLHAVICYKFFG